MGTRLLLAGTYIGLGMIGVLLLSLLDRPDATLYGSLLVLIAVGGLAMVGHPVWFDRHRPGPELATAPSGAPALYFRRSPFIVTLSVLFCVAFAGWLGAAAVLLYRGGHVGWGSSLVALALLVLWPVGVAALGRIGPGGLWLTPSGVQHRNEALSWAVPWSDVIDVVAGEPVLLRLRVGARPATRRTVRWVWNRVPRTPEGSVGIPTAYLAGGAELVVAVLADQLTHPRQRELLGTAESLRAIRAEPLRPHTPR
jgi:hypothetical protein